MLGNRKTSNLLVNYRILTVQVYRHVSFSRPPTQPSLNGWHIFRKKKLLRSQDRPGHVTLDGLFSPSVSQPIILPLLLASFPLSREIDLQFKQDFGHSRTFASIQAKLYEVVLHLCD
jgi:hypothetical protein